LYLLAFLFLTAMLPCCDGQIKLYTVTNKNVAVFDYNFG